MMSSSRTTRFVVGNEDFFDKSGSYNQRFVQFTKAINVRYPAIKVISSVGFEQPEPRRVRSVVPDMVDEHYYPTVETFLKMSRGHDEKYDRKGPELFVGEWGAYETPFEPWNERSRKDEPTPNMRAALGDAVFMTRWRRTPTS